MLRGSASAKIDDKGRLKVPTGFKAVIADTHGTELFVTSLSGESVRIYPMPVWLEVERRLALMPSTHPSRQRFLDHVNFYGQETEFDVQGRVLIQPRLRESALMSGEVDVLGQQNFLEVWNHDRFVTRLKESFTEEDARALADYGI